MNKDIFDSMIGMGLDMVILEILTMLDSQSIANARLTCHKWRNEIDQLLWHTETGKKYLYILNKNNFIHNEPIVTTKQLNSDAFDLKYDDKDIVVGTNNGKVICFNTDTLELRWEQQNIGDSIQLAFNDYAIFTVSTDLTITVLRRSDGHILYQIDHSDPDNHEESIFGVRVWNNRLATCCREGYIKFYDIDYMASKVLNMTKSVDKYSSLTHLDNDENNLISSASSGELVLWDFQTGQEVKTMATRHHIMAVVIKLPYVVTCTAHQSYRNDNEGVKIFNFEQGTLIRYLPVGLASDIQLTSMWLMICRDNNLFANTQEDSTVELYYWPDVIQETSVTLEQVTSRSIKVEANPPNAIVTGGMSKTKMITAEGDHIVVRKYWP